MAMVCPQCRTTYEQRLQCPLCATRLLFHDVRRLPEVSPQQAVRWRQRPGGRIFLGLVLAQGLFYGLHHLLTAGLLALQGREAIQQMETTATGVLLFPILRMAALFVAAVLAGGGQRKAVLLGILIGACNGVLSVLLRIDLGQVRTPIALLGQPLWQAGVGAVGGWCGAALWKPLSATDTLSIVEAEKEGPRPRRFLRRNLNFFSGPVAWVRVAAGAILAVTGALAATLLFEQILDLSHGKLATTDEWQDHLIILEIKALALLSGGLLAGATTRNGLKQGLCVGLAATVLLLGIERNAVKDWKDWLQMAASTALAALSLSLAGGWFGSQLFPPLVRKRRRPSRTSGLVE